MSELRSGFGVRGIDAEQALAAPAAARAQVLFRAEADQILPVFARAEARRFSIFAAHATMEASARRPIRGDVASRKFLFRGAIFPEKDHDFAFGNVDHLPLSDFPLANVSLSSAGAAPVAPSPFLFRCHRSRRHQQKTRHCEEELSHAHHRTSRDPSSQEVERALRRPATASPCCLWGPWLQSSLPFGSSHRWRPSLRAICIPRPARIEIALAKLDALERRGGASDRSERLSLDEWAALELGEARPEDSACARWPTRAANSSTRRCRHVRRRPEHQLLERMHVRL
jgi:hypothetical protein